MKPNQRFLGIEIGGTKLQLAVADASGQITQALRNVIDPVGGAEAIRKQITEAWGCVEQKNKIAATGIGFGGPVDWRSGTIRVSHQVAGWSGFNLGQWMGELTGKPVVVENDANVAALAEAVYGSGIGHERVFYMTIGSGIGGGLVVGGSIYHGGPPGEVEVGHLRLNESGDTLESLCSGWAVNKKVSVFIGQNPNSVLARLAEGHTGAAALLLQPALEQGDKGAKGILNDVADDLAFGLSHVVHLFHPDVLVIGGGLSLLGKHLLEPITQKLPQYVMPAFWPPPPIRIAALGEKVVPTGAVELAKRVTF